MFLSNHLAFNSPLKVNLSRKDNDMKFIFDRTTQTTSLVDMAVICLLAQKIDLHKLLEVGVYRGGFIRTFLMNVKKAMLLELIHIRMILGQKMTC